MHAHVAGDRRATRLRFRHEADAGTRSTWIHHLLPLDGDLFFAAGTLLRYRPNLNPGVPVELFGSQYPGGKILNSAAFSAAPAGQQGNFGRNVLRGFGVFQVGLALQRRVELTQKVALRLRTEFFND